MPLGSKTSKARFMRIKQSSIGSLLLNPIAGLNKDVNLRLGANTFFRDTNLIVNQPDPSQAEQTI